MLEARAVDRLRITTRQHRTRTAPARVCAASISGCLPGLSTQATGAGLAWADPDGSSLGGDLKDARTLGHPPLALHPPPLLVPDQTSKGTYSVLPQ
ncbi:hypothetical protein CTRI78_v002436 [Colletotrichum trifolii]|uniref:Uncharacterized protein n=1 Tax=Colletotrichum trifolii TaxID=5466 RepID=A0A4V3HX41_COLTR|nr:hypothetical protein CTRI78_v002436 [Colletotrichum trifolii]